MEYPEWSKRIGQKIEQDYKRETPRQSVIREAEIFNATLRQQGDALKEGNAQYSLSPFLKRKQENGIPLSDVEKDFVKTFQTRSSLGISPPFEIQSNYIVSNRP